MTTPTLTQVVEKATIPLTTPPKMSFDDQSSRPFDCEGEDAVKRYKGMTRVYAETWRKLSPIADQVRVLHPGVFRERDDRGLPVFFPFSLDGNGVSSITVARETNRYSPGFNTIFSEDFRSVASHYSDVAKPIVKLGTEKYDQEHPVGDGSSEAQLLRLRRYSLTRKTITVFGTTIIFGLLLAMFGIIRAIVIGAETSSPFFIGSELIVVGVTGAVIGCFIQKRREVIRGNREMALREIASEMPRLRFSITQKFSGTIPADVRALIRDYRKREFFDDIFLVTQGRCEVEYEAIPAPKSIPIDPLVVGVRNGDDRYFLIGQFDLLPNERRVTKEAEFLMSGIDWDAEAAAL